MHSYDLENQMWGRQRTELRDADNRRLVAMAHTRPDAKRATGMHSGVRATFAAGLRALLRGRAAPIERPGLGDAS